MADEKEILQKLQKVYNRCYLMTHGELINAIESVIEYHHIGSFNGPLNGYKDDYNRMMHYMMEGFDDDMRSRLYQQNQRGLIVMLRKMMHEARVAVVPSLGKAFESRKDFDFTQVEQRLLCLSQEITVAQFSGDDAVKKAYELQNDFRQQLFNAVFSSGPMGQNEGYYLQNILLNEALEETDILLFISALMLAQQFDFDPERFRLLLLALNSTKNDEIRQRVLVSIAFSMPSEVEIKLYPELKDEFLTVVNSAELIRTFSNLQTQVLYSVTAAEDMQKMNRDIMPTIMDEMKRHNMMNSDVSSLEDILHPDNDEKSMDAIEEKIDKMRKMQEMGSDMLFGGFSAMKRYGFFYTLVNWFYPYSANHPAVARINSDPAMQKLFRSLEGATQLCDSDKYSMVFGLNHVFGSLPEQLKQMLQSGEARIGVLDEELSNDVNYRRRMYLQSLYRFYNLYSSKNDFNNPFAEQSRWCFLLHPYFKYKAEEANILVGLAHRLLQKNRVTEALQVLQADKMHEGTADYLVLLGTCYYRQGKYSEAVNAYQQALFLDSDNDKLRLRLGRLALESRKWVVAEQTFTDIRLYHPEAYTTEAKLGLAEALLNQNKLEAVREVILPFDFVEEQTVTMRRLLGWYYLLAGKHEKSLTYYSQIADSDRLTEDYFHIAFVHLCLHDCRSAVLPLGTFFGRNDSTAILADKMSSCIDYLALAGLTHEEWSILVDLSR